MVTKNRSKSGDTKARCHLLAHRSPSPILSGTGTAVLTVVVRTGATDRLISMRRLTLDSAITQIGYPQTRVLHHEGVAAVEEARVTWGLVCGWHTRPQN